MYKLMFLLPLKDFGPMAAFPLQCILYKTMPLEAI